MGEPTGISAQVAAILDKADNLLKGEPARAIGYGAGIVILGVSLVSNALGFTRIPAVDLQTAVGDATLATATLITIVEGIRHFVYSINSTERIAAISAATGEPVVPAPPAKDL